MEAFYEWETESCSSRLHCTFNSEYVKHANSILCTYLLHAYLETREGFPKFATGLIFI